MSFKFNPLTGELDLVGSGGDAERRFDIYKLPTGESLEIPENDQAFYSLPPIIEGDLMVSGYLLPVGSAEREEYFFTKIEQDKTIRVKKNRLLLYVQSLLVEGNLLVEGDLRSI